VLVWVLQRFYRRWNEWVDHSRMLKHNPPSVLMRSKLLEEVLKNKNAAANKKGKTCTSLWAPTIRHHDRGLSGNKTCCAVGTVCSPPFI
jgi:hypothetical protein